MTEEVLSLKKHRVPHFKPAFQQVHVGRLAGNGKPLNRNQFTNELFISALLFSMYRRSF
jgi:hypothetical protein